jgi:hypothetical protein
MGLDDSSGLRHDPGGTPYRSKPPAKDLDPNEHSSEEAPAGQNSSRTLLFYSISLSLIETNPKMN